VLVIAHRLSSVKRADHVIVLENGRVAEQGGHRELVTANGHYRQILRMQLAHEAHLLAVPGEGA
jgi:ABC-type multidrug transport system fused ATPase/permease subunit